jgi:hypothetical protein
MILMRIISKRGEWTLLQTIMIVGGIIVAFILVTIVLRVTSKERAEADFLAKDSAMLADAILSAPQDVQIIYPKEFTKQYARLGASSIAIFLSAPELGEESPYTHFFVPRKDIAVTETELKLSAFFMIKDSKTFTISAVPFQQEVGTP